MHCINDSHDLVRPIYTCMYSNKKRLSMSPYGTRMYSCHWITSQNEECVPKSIQLLSSPVQTVVMSAPNIAFWGAFLEFRSSSDPGDPLFVLSWNFEKEIPRSPNNPFSIAVFLFVWRPLYLSFSSRLKPTWYRFWSVSLKVHFPNYFVHTNNWFPALLSFLLLQQVSSCKSLCSS